MVLLKSDQRNLGEPLPSFSLPSVDGQSYSDKSFPHNVILVVMFICNHCPYVQAIEDRYIQIAKDYAGSVQLVGICSNDATDYPDDRPEKLLHRWENKKYGFPYLIDEDQSVAKKFKAVCTPDIFVYDEDRNLVYHGQLDDNWKDASKVSSHDLRNAIDALLDGDMPNEEQQPSMGCSIKWKDS